MSKMMQSLTPDQKKFAIVGSLSLVAVGIMIFLVHGLSGVSFQFNDDAAFERRQKERETTALTNVWNALAARTALLEAGVAAYPDNEQLETIVTEVGLYTDALRTVLTEKSIKVVEPSKVTVPDTAPTTCERALEKENELVNILSAEIERIGVNPDVYNIFTVLTTQSETIVIPALEVCAGVSQS